MKLQHSYSSIKQFENCPQRFYRQRILKDIVDQGGEASKHGDRVHTHMENRIRFGTKLPDELAQCEPVCKSIEGISIGAEYYAEKELVLNEFLQPTQWWSDDAWLRSKLDVLIVHPVVAFVFDWKTGKRKPDFLQMGLFALQVFKHYPGVKKVDTAFIWLKDMKMDKEVYTRETISEVLADLLSRVHRIHQSVDTGNWPARPSGLCGYCPAQPTCQWARTR